MDISAEGCYNPSTKNRGRENGKIYPLRYYAVCHSYLVHGPFEGWQTSGFWGMAASEPSKDYFHRFQHHVSRQLPCAFQAIAENYATYERLCTVNATRETYCQSPEYKQIKMQLKTFQPNIISLFIGGGNTIAKDEASLTLLYEVLYSLVAENMPKDAIVICPCSNKRAALSLDLAKKYGFLPVDLRFIHEAASKEENPYYAFKCYPEYDEAAKAGAIEFRTHPSDLGHDTIAKCMTEACLSQIKERITPVAAEGIQADTWETKTENQVRTANEIPAHNMDCWTFGSLREMAGVILGGFNMRLENGIGKVSSATDTGVAVYHNKLHLPAKDYRTFRVCMQLDCDEREVDVVLQVNADREKLTKTYRISHHTMEELTLDVTQLRNVITGFRIEPQTPDCCIHVKKIVFEK